MSLDQQVESSLETLIISAWLNEVIQNARLVHTVFLQNDKSLMGNQDRNPGAYPISFLRWPSHRNHRGNYSHCSYFEETF